MQAYLVKTTQYLLCSVSMLLTGLFALSFASSQTLNLPFIFPAKDYLASILMIIIGICIDLSKYLFWGYRSRHYLFLSISALLVLFSWSASVAFFVTQENMNIEIARQNTAAYQAHLSKIQATQIEINSKNKLMEKRLASKYHQQWDKGEELINSIETMNQRLHILIEEKETVGLKEAQLQMSTSAFFLSLSQLFSIPIYIVANSIYAILALLIEICALGTISLSRTISLSKLIDEKNIKNIADQVINNCESDLDILQKNILSNTSDPDEKIKELCKDILEKKTEPIISRLTKIYKLQYDVVKSLMDKFVDEGVLKKKNNRYFFN